MSFLKTIWNPKKVCVIFLNYTATGIHISASKVSKKIKNRSITEFDTIEAVIKKFGKENPYHIHLQGAGILTRMVENIPNYKEQLIVNGDKDDFYFTSLEIGSKIITSFFRKALINEIIKQLSDSKAFLINITAGIVPCLLEIEKDGKVSFDYEVEVKNGEIETFNKVETAKSFGFKSYEETICDSTLLSTANSFLNYSGGFEAEEKSSYFQNYKDYSQFRFFGLSTVFSILFLLVGNFFYLKSLNQDVADLEIELSLNNENLSVIDRLKQEKTRKEQLIQTSGINAKSFISFYIDEIGRTVPKNINLLELYVFPLKERLKEKRKVEISQENIEIKGVTQSSSVLDDWMEKMNRFEWVERVELINYTKSETNQAEFKLIVSISK